MNYDQQCSNVKECFLANINDGNNANHEHLDHASDAIKQFLISVRGSSDLTATARQIWKEIISRTLVIILSVDHLPNETALKSFHSKVHPLTTNPHYKILPEVDDLQDLLQLAKEGPWISLSYKLILSGKKCNHHEVRKLIKHESVQVVTHRIKAILPDSKIAYNYGKHVITISKFKHVSEIQRLLQTAAVKCLNKDEVETAMDDFDLSITLEVIEELRSSNEHKESFLLCHALLMRMWKSEHVAQELQKVLKNWVYLLQSIHGPRFHEEMHEILNDAEQTAVLSTYYVYLLNTIWDDAVGKSSVIPTSVYNTCSEIILKSLELMQNETDSEIVKIDILEKLASYYPDSVISRLSNLAIFFISPTLSRYLTVADGQKKKSKNNKIPEGGDIIVLLPVHLETLMPPNLDPEFKKWIVLRDDLIPYLSEEDAIAAAEKDLDIEEDNETTHEETKFSPEESSFPNASPLKSDEGSFRSSLEFQMEFAEKATSVLQNHGETKKKTEKKKSKGGWECPEGCIRLFKTMLTLKEHLKRKHGWSSDECKAMRESMGLQCTAVWPADGVKRKRGRPSKIKPKEKSVQKKSPTKPFAGEKSMEDEPVVKQKIQTESIAMEDDSIVSQMEESAEDVMMSDHLEAMPLQEEKSNGEKAEEEQMQTKESSTLKQVLTSLLPKENENAEKPANTDKRKYICPICEREFSHRHTVQAHAIFRHHKREEEGIEIGKNAKEIIEEDENGEDEVVNAMVHAKGWYPHVDDFVQEILEEDENTPHTLRNNLSEHIFETVTHMYPHTAPTSLDYKAAANYLESSWNLKGSQNNVQDSTNGLNNGEVDIHSSNETSGQLQLPEATSHLNDFPQDVHFSIDKHDFSDFGTYSSDDRKEPVKNDIKHNNHLPTHKNQEVSSIKRYAVKYSLNSNKGNKSKKFGKATYNKVYVKKKRSETEATENKTTPKVNKTKAHKGMTFEEALNLPVSTPKTKAKHSKSMEGGKTPIAKNPQNKKIRRKSHNSQTPPSKIQSASESDSQSSAQIGYSKLMEHAEKNKKDKKARTSSNKTPNDSDNSEIPPNKKSKLSESDQDSVSSSNHKRSRKSSFRKYSKSKNPIDDSEERTDILGEMLDQMNNNNKILMPLDSDEEKADSDFICTICNKILTSEFALVCHRRKVHKSKSKVFIPAAMSEKMKIRQLNRNYGPQSKLPKNAKPVSKNSSDIADVPVETCAQARGKKSYKRKKIIISKSGNRYPTKELRDVFANESGGFSCPFETCLNWYDSNRLLTRHFINDHCATAQHVMDLVIESDIEYFKNHKEESCKQEDEIENSSTPGRQLVKRLAATEAAKKISTPEKAKRMWSEYQDLARLYKKSVRKNVARALIPNSDDSDIEMIDRSFELNSQVDAKALLVEGQISARNEFFCWICQPCHQESFSDLSNFTLHVLHMLKNIDQYPFRCTKPGCLYGFRVHKNLRKHQRMHKVDDGFHYLCHFCPANEISFQSPEGLLQHEKRMHAKVQNRLTKLRRMYCLNNIDLSGNKINEHFLEFGHRTHHDIWKYEAENVLCDVLNAVEEYFETQPPSFSDTESSTVPPPPAYSAVENAGPQSTGQEIFSLMKDFQVFKMPTFEGTESNALTLENYDDTLAEFEDIGQVSVEESVKLLVMSMIDTVEQSLQIDSLLDEEIDQVGFGELDDEIAAITGTKFYAFWEQKKNQEDIHSPIPESFPHENEDLQVQSVTTISVENDSNSLTIPVDGGDHAFEPQIFTESTSDALDAVVNDESEKDDGAVKYCFATPVGASNFEIQTISKTDLINYTSAVRMKNMSEEQEETENRITEIVEEEVEEQKIKEIEDEIDEEDEVALSNFVKKPGRRKREVVHKREASSDMEVLVNKRARRNDNSLSPPLKVAEEELNISKMQPVVVCKELDKELLKSPQSVSTNTDHTEMNDSFTNTSVVEQDNKESQANIPQPLGHVLDDAFAAINRISDFQDLVVIANRTREFMVALKGKLESMKNSDVLNDPNECISTTKTMSTQTEVKKSKSPVSATDGVLSSETAVTPYQIMYHNIPTTSKTQLVVNYKPNIPISRPKQVQIVRPLAKQAFSRDKSVVKQTVPPTQATTNPITTLAIARRPVDNSAFQQPQSRNIIVQRSTSLPSSVFPPRVIQSPLVTQSTPQVYQSRVAQSTPQSQANVQQSYEIPYHYTNNKIKYSQSQSYTRLEEAARLLRVVTARNNRISQPFTDQRPPKKQPQTTTSIVPKHHHYMLQNPPKQPDHNLASQSTYRTVSPRNMIETMNHQQYLLQDIMSISEIEDNPTSDYYDYQHLNEDIYSTETIVTTDVVTSNETAGSNKKESPEVILNNPLQTLNMHMAARNKTVIQQPQKITLPPPQPTPTAPSTKLYTYPRSFTRMEDSTPSVLRDPYRGIAQAYWNEETQEDKIDFAFTNKDASMTTLEVFSDVCNFLSQVIKRRRQSVCKMCKSSPETNLEFYLHVLSHTNKQVLKFVRERERAISYKRGKRKSNVIDKDLKVVIKPLLVHPDEVVFHDLENQEGMHADEINFDKKTCEIFLKAESGKKCGEIMCRFEKCKKRIGWISDTRDEAMKHFKQHMFGHHVSAGYYSQETPLFHSSVQLQPL